MEKNGNNDQKKEYKKPAVIKTDITFTDDDMDISEKEYTAGETYTKTYTKEYSVDYSKSERV